MCLSLMSATFVCVVVHVIEKGYPVWVLDYWALIEQAETNLHPLPTVVMVCSGFERCVKLDYFGHLDSYWNPGSPMYPIRPENLALLYGCRLSNGFLLTCGMCDPYVNDIIGTQNKEGMSDQDLIVVGL